MRFLFRLDLSLHAGAGIFFRILIFATKRGPSLQTNGPSQISVLLLHYL